MDTSKYKALYLQETGEHLAGIEQGLLKLEGDPLAEDVVDDLFRHYHSIKGMSASMGYEPLQRLAHAQEDLLDRIRSKDLSVSEGLISRLFECLDGLKLLVRCVEEDTALDHDISGYLEKIKAASEPGALAEAEEPQGPEPQAGKSGPEAGAEAVVDGRDAPGDREETLRISHVMKVEGSVFDELLTDVGELYMALSGFKAFAQSSRSIAFKDEVHALGKSINRIYNRILTARMLPVSDLTESLPRVVRDISKKKGKEVELKMLGTEISLDRSILESLGSPLVHIMRNAVDHGIETPGERTRAGKPQGGTIALRAYARKDRVVIEVADDGRGIDPEKIRKKALDRGMSPEWVASISDKEAIMLVCEPGFSSSETVTDTSGRGVGMDVVRGAVENLGGKLDIESGPGRGTRIVMELPRTTSITKALAVRVSGELLLIPISKIVKVIETGAFAPVGEAGADDSARGAIEFEGAEVPVASLAGLLGMEQDERIRASTVIIVDNNETPGDARFVGLRVDSFSDEINAYIKPLVAPISRLWGVSGITVMGDGRPVFLLDLAQITAKAVAR